MSKLKEDEVFKQPPTFSEYKGQPVISLPLVEGSSFRFTFGLTKARLILEYESEIKEFVKRYQTTDRLPCGSLRIFKTE